MEIFLLILFGIVGGVFGGMGMGGGTFLIPLLTIFLGFNQQLSQLYNLLSFCSMAIIAIIIHSKNKLIEWKKVLCIVLPALPFSIAGAFIANLVNKEILRLLFGAFLFVLSLLEIYKIFVENEK